MERPRAAVGIKRSILLDQSFKPALVRYVPSLPRIPALIQFRVNPFAVMHCNAFSLSFILSSSLFCFVFLLVLRFLSPFYPYSLVHSFFRYLFPFFSCPPLVAAIFSSSLLLALIYFLNMAVRGVAATPAIMPPCLQFSPVFAHWLPFLGTKVQRFQKRSAQDRYTFVNLNI